MSKTNKVSEEELQQWLEQVHFGSCCSDLSQEDVAHSPKQLHPNNQGASEKCATELKKGSQ
ncbi:hypothetical protein D1Z90_14660 [Motilimonas pumila]|uniref:Uncharacterized protein n=2 Tax=Motilimonas pumila TaxID=2303987 RepID=A0A418YCJ7_9GAMM|nr:hypothetical protein D1Z90_14660 [Motilimonas pumila]